MAEQPLYCQNCNSQVSIAHRDDVGTQFYSCPKCGYVTETKLAKTKPGSNATEPASGLAKLDHLNCIENPALAKKPVVVEAVVSSTSIAYIVPSKLKLIIKEENQAPYDIYPSIKQDDPLNVNLVGISAEIKYKRLERNFRPEQGGRILNIEEQKMHAVYLLRVRPPVFTLEKRGEKIVDEKGFEYKCFDIYVATDQAINFEASSLIRLEGYALPNPRTQRTTFLAYKVEFPEENHVFNGDRLLVLKSKFAGKTVKERLNWILDNFERYSRIIGRSNIAEAILLGFYTPLWVELKGEIQRGWGNVEICGDTTAGKSESVRKAIALLKTGSLITAETASTVGLTGTATQLEREGWFIDWGFLVLSDRKLLAIDGAHKLSLANWAALAEAERSGVLTIAKAAKNTAYARTRQIKIANAIDREADKYSTKSLSAFLYKVQALATILDKTSIARIDVAVFADQRDVGPEKINSTTLGEPEQELGILSESLKWCWSNTVKTEFTDDALEVLLNKATELHNLFFCEMIPLASIDLKWKLARLSVALAYLTLSTEDLKTVTVTQEHVEAVAEFIQEEYANAGLGILAQETKFEKIDAEDVKMILSRVVGKCDIEMDELQEILRYIVTRGRVTKDELSTHFSLADKNEVRPLVASLQSERLVKVSRGYYPEPKLIEAYKVTGGFSFQ